MNRALIILIALFSIASCTKEAAQNIVPSSDEVTFTTSNSLTRATEDKSSWAEDDRIGVYVMDSGNTLQKYNIEYKATSGTPDTSFSAAGDDKAYFLGYDIKTSFTVYYPYDEDITDENVTIELDTKQNDLLISGVARRAENHGE